MVDGVATFLSSSGVPVGDKKITASTRRANARIRHKLVFTDPIVVNEVINGVTRPSVDRVNYVNVEFNFADNSTRQERDDLVGKFYSSLASGQVALMAMIVDGEGFY
jgi:hypothetical protein